MRLAKKHVTVIKMLAYTGSSKREVALTNGISEQTLYNWLRDETFKKTLDDFRERYLKAMREYSENGIERERLFNLLGITDDEEWLIRDVLDETLAQPSYNNENRVKLNSLVTRALELAEQKLNDGTADSQLLTFFLERILK